MENILILFCFLNIYCVLARNGDSQSTQNKLNDHNQREGKLFSLFSIVQFKNEACTSSQTLSNTASGSQNVARNGTCYSSTECRDKSGQAAGGCAAGFGVCCVFVYEASGSTISQNCSYIRNPNYPNAYTDTTSLQYNIVKCDPSVCHLRLDFESFDINGLTDSVEYENAMAVITCTDRFTITSSADPGLPEICGRNNGQHVYVDIGTGASDTATLNFDFSDSTALQNSRFFEVKVTQLPCSSEYNRFPGCFQYHEGLTGRIETFNYQNCGNSQSHLPNQDYSICVRPEAGYDCIQWQVCPEGPCGSLATAGTPYNLPDIAAPEGPPCVGFSVGENGDGNVPALATECGGDLIRINGASTACCQGTNPTPTQDAFCGWIFNIDPAKMVKTNVPICDCVAPFSIDIEFDALSDEGAADPAAPAMTPNDKTSCGLCLIYNQVRC